jgi:hypothetical protein
MWDFLITPMFTDTTSEDARIRSAFGIVQQPGGTKAHTVIDEKLCRNLEHIVRETLRRSPATPLRLNDVVPTYIQVGRYYYVSLSLKNPLPPGREGRMPAIIIDGSTMQLLRLIFE